MNDDRQSRSQRSVTRAQTIGSIIATLATIVGIVVGVLTVGDFVAQPGPTAPAPAPERTARAPAPEASRTVPGPVSEEKARTASASAPETTAATGQQEPPSEQKPKPEFVKSSTCLLAAKPSDLKISTAESVGLIVDLSVPSHARECHDTVTIDAPTFSLGKEPKQTVSIVPPAKSDAHRWLLEPEKVGSWEIAVETKEERDIVSMVVTTPIGFSARWVQAGVITGGATTLVLGALAVILRRG